MKYRKPLVVALIIVVVAIAISLVLANKKPVEAPTENQGVPTELPINNKPITMQPEMISVAEDSYVLGISGFYPKFSQTDDAFNKKIADFVTSGVATFKKEANADYQARLETGGDDFKKQFETGGMYTYQIKTDLVQSNNDFISMTITIDGYSGGAHGYETKTSFNYDVKNKKDITLDYFYPNNPNYLKIISDISRTSLTPQVEKATDQKPLDPFTKEMLTDGTDPARPINFEVFTFTNDILTIYFGQYQVAAYAYGQFTVDIPRK